MSKILFVGQAPSQETDGQPPFTGKCGKFLADLMCLTQEQMLEQHEFVNVFERFQGKSIGGDRFPFPQAKFEAKKLLPMMIDRPVVLLGMNVARAFGATQFKYLETYELRHPEYPSKVMTNQLWVMPHPSGINRYWNKGENRDIARKFLAGLMKRVSESPQ